MFHIGIPPWLPPGDSDPLEAEIVLDIDRDAGCCRVALDENPSVTWQLAETWGKMGKITVTSPREMEIEHRWIVG